MADIIRLLSRTCYPKVRDADAKKMAVGGGSGGAAGTAGSGSHCRAGGGFAGYTFTPMDRQQSCASLRCRIFLPAKKQGAVPADSTAPDTSSNVTLALFGVVPVKTVRAVTTARRTVQLCGTPFGVKLFSDGALVVAFSDRYTALGSENPAKTAGLRLGDLIISANGQPVRSNEDLTSAIQAAGGAPLTVLFTDAAKANVRQC